MTLDMLRLVWSGWVPGPRWPGSAPWPTYSASSPTLPADAAWTSSSRRSAQAVDWLIVYFCYCNKTGVEQCCRFQIPEICLNLDPDPEICLTLDPDPSLFQQLWYRTGTLSIFKRCEKYVFCNKLFFEKLFHNKTMHGTWWKFLRIWIRIRNTNPDPRSCWIRI